MPLPVLLHVDTITINSIKTSVDAEQAICNEALWTRFAETAVKLPHLRHVELLGNWKAGSAYDPASMGVTDEAFQPLLDAGKSIFEYWDDGKMRKTKDTVNPKAKKSQEDKEASGGGGGSGSRVEAETVVDHSVEGHCEYAAFDSTLVDVDNAVQRKRTLTHLQSRKSSRRTLRKLPDCMLRSYQV